MRRTLILLLALAVLACAAPSTAATTDQGPVALHWELYRLDKKSLAQAGGLSGFDLLAVLVLTPEPGWYAYANDEAGPGKRPTVLTMRTGPDASPLPVYYPPGTPKPDIADPGDAILTYPGPTRLYLPLPDDLSVPFELTAELDLVLCQGTRCAEPDIAPRLAVSIEDGVAASPARFEPCWPEFLAALEQGPGHAGPGIAATFKPIQDDAPSPAQSFEPRSLQASAEISGLLMAVLLGMLAGLILNVMPCVLPVISLKLAAVLATCGLEPDNKEFARSAAKRAVRLHALWFALGILLYFLFLAGLLGLGGLAWGELFQDPAAVLSVTVLVFVLGLSMLGVFHLPVVDLKFDRRTSKPRLQALLTGLLATLLATPCSGPFLGGVLSWALSRPPETVALVFLGVGAGMSLPYLTLALFPGMARCVPRPGVWTWYLEKGVGLFLLGTCIYLLNILPTSLLLRALVALWLAGVAAWLWGSAGTGLSRLRPLLLKLAALVLVVGGILWALHPSTRPDPWERYDPALFAEALGRETLVVDFTADWCPTCKVLESTVLSDGRVAAWEREFGVRAVKVDLTGDDPEAEALLTALGVRSIPVLAVFPAGPDSARPLLLRDLFTAGQVKSAILQALEK